MPRRYGVHRTTVMQHLEKRGVPRRANKRKLNDDQAQELKHLHNLGISYVELSKKYGVSVDTVKREIAKH